MNGMNITTVCGSPIIARTYRKYVHAVGLPHINTPKAVQTPVFRISQQMPVG